MSDKETLEQQSAPEEIRLAKARWCYAHASRPVAEVEMLDDAELEGLAVIHDAVAEGLLRLDNAMTEFLAARSKRLEEAKAVVATEETAEDE